MKRMVEILLILLSVLLVTGFISKSDKKELEKLLTQFIPSPSLTQTVFLSPQVLGEQLGESVLVTRVIDGDTIEIEGGKTVRYIGINTPETVDPRRGTQCFGKEASDFNKNLVLGKRVKLEKDVSETDRYGRLLRYVYLQPNLDLGAKSSTTSAQNTIFVNETLVQEGFAYASSYPPDIKHQPVLREVERMAREGKKGLWGKCN